MKAFFEKEEYSKEDIQNLIDSRVEESTYLDFKSGAFLNGDDVDGGENKRGKNIAIEISKDVAAFANADGGVIIYGIKEKDFVADQFVFVDARKCSQDRLTQIINSSTERTIRGIEITPFQFEEKVEQMVYLVKIPRSVDAPHMNKEKIYYVRRNALIDRMEEYEVRDSYSRDSNPRLEVDKMELRGKGRGQFNQYYVELYVSVVNSGNTIAENFGVTVSLFHDIAQTFHVSGTTLPALKDVIKRDKQIDVINSGTTPIFPGQSVTAINFEFGIDPSYLDHIKDSLRVDLKVFFKGGVVEIHDWDYRIIGLTR